jgi:O-methyltransferase
MVTSLKSLILRGIEVLGYRLERTDAVFPYDTDGLRVQGKHVPFLADARFTMAYQRGLAAAGDRYGKLDIAWRVAVTCWAAQHGSRLPGDFVECGVTTGMHALAACHYVDFNSLDKSFYLFDTFCGIPPDQMSDVERPARLLLNENYFSDAYYKEAQRNFEPFPRARLICGKVPDTLPTAGVDRVCYLLLDMSVAYPERKAIEFFWPKLSTGAVVVVDDYAWHGYEPQAQAIDEFARSVGVEILSLPTGQGIIIKP